MDTLLAAGPSLDGNVGVYCIGGEPTQAYLDLCQEKGLDNVHFVGFQKKEALANYYMAADLLVLPTQSDVWGLVINEAMACGLPVLTTPYAGARELIKEGETGYLFDVQNPQQTRKALKRMSESDYREMGRKARRLIEDYSNEKVMRKTAEILERI